MFNDMRPFDWLVCATAMIFIVVEVVINVRHFVKEQKRKNGKTKY